MTLGEPLKFTTEVEIKFVPFTISVNAAPPAVAPPGTNDVIVATGLLAAVTLKFITADVPPPGAGFVTVTGGVPTVATAVAGIDAVSTVELTKVVVVAAPLKFTTAPLTKPVPFTVNVNVPDPATTPVGDNEVIVGTGLVTPLPA